MNSGITRLLRKRWVWAIGGGIMLALSQPKFNIAGFAWVAPALLLLATLGATSKKAFWTGYIGGLTQQLITVYWLLNIPFPAGAIAGWLAVSAYLAIYPAIWCWLAWRLFPLPLRGELFNSTPTDHFTETSVLQRAAWAALCACAWVAIEMAITRVLGGFPWNFLGASQYQMLPLIQISSVTGVYGVSFLMAWFACSLFSAGMILTRHHRSRKWSFEIAPALLVVAIVFANGLSQIRARPASSRSVKLALVQPSIPQTLIFDPKENANRFNELVQLSERALETKPDILVWPEAAVPNMLRWDTNTSNALINLVTTNRVWAIVGSDDAVPKSNDPNFVIRTEDDLWYYNSCFVLSPRGEIAGTYRKRLLVMFGEFVPFSDWLPFMKYLTPVGDASFRRGEQPVSFHLGDLDVTTAPLICFEDTFGDFARQYVTDDTDFLLNITNNGWFGESAAQWQHAAAAIFRAVENHIPLVRCANNGLTCWVDDVGRMHNVYNRNSQDIYGPCFKTVTVPVLAKGEKRPLTFYNHYGDVFGWLCVGLTAAGFSLRGQKRLVQREQDLIE